MKYTILKYRASSWSDFTKKRSIGDRYLTWHTYILLGYALLGRGFAYLGYPPVYIGEITLAFGLVVWGFNRFFFNVFRLLPALFLVGFMCWCGIRTLPYLSQYGIDALRDGAIWGYALFAFIVATLLIAKPERLRTLLNRYARFVVLFTILAPVLWVLQTQYEEALPEIPNMAAARSSEFDSWLIIQATELLVHLAGITAFVLVGLGSASFFFLLVISVEFLAAAWQTRGGMVAYLTSLFVVALVSPSNTRLWRALTIGVVAIVVLSLSGIAIQTSLGFSARELSFEQIVANLQSIGTDRASGGLSDTRQWRLDWWNMIINYTFGGNYFWTGQGFGINIADVDGFQEGGSLRSPHNIHMTILARAGVPGLLLWLLVQLSWALGVLGSYLRSRRGGESRWASVFLFLLAYWTAFIINSSFTVSLEGPYGGIWFWTVFGVGLAAMWIYKHHPKILSYAEEPVGGQ